MRGLVWIVVGLSACFETPQEVLDDVVCEHVCSCFPIVDCEATCLALFAPVSQECFDVVSANAQSCVLVAQTLQTGGVCRSAIPGPEPEPE